MTLIINLNVINKCVCGLDFRRLPVPVFDPPRRVFSGSGRRGSRINTDRFPKRALKAQTFSEVQGLAPPKNYLDFYSSKSPFLAF